MLLFALNIFLSAFLLFQIQPMIGKAILPWFGGTPAVWSTLMLVFQVLLTGGYAYSTWLIQRTGRQAQIHLSLLGLALAIPLLRIALGMSPVEPSFSSSATIHASPVLAIVQLLLFSAALPFLVLSSNGPLMQAWFSRLHPTRSYARLYALSNVGSLLGLLTYPFVLEPNFTLAEQGWIWFLGFLLFVALSAWIALQSRRTASPSKPTPLSSMSAARPPLSLLALWIALSATASLFLLSVTNQISQEVAVIPFLWILPLTIYLLSFIFTFSGERGYHRTFYAILFLVAVALTLFVMLNATRIHVYWQILTYSLLLFAACMLCHGELYRLRPAADGLTTFYLMVSIGGAVGGVFVSLIAPLLFNGYWEFFVALAMTLALVLTILRPSREESARARFVFTVFILATVMLALLSSSLFDPGFSRRNFYGVIRVREAMVGEPPQRAYIMSHGITVHGIQFLGDGKTPEATTTYYVPGSGVGLALLNHPKYGQQPMHVGLLGLGAGTLVAYAQPGDLYRLYEINPTVIDLAAGDRDYFSFLSDSPADITVVPGDARVSLQREWDSGEPQNFDVLVLDTFSSDSIPVHLVTEEAFGVYLAHMAPDGVIAAHVTNLHLDLQPVFWKLAEQYGLSIVRIEYSGDTHGGFASHWILLARDPAVLNDPTIQQHAVDLNGYSTTINLWTDDYSNLFQILK